MAWAWRGIHPHMPTWDLTQAAGPTEVSLPTAQDPFASGAQNPFASGAQDPCPAVGPWKWDPTPLWLEEVGPHPPWKWYPTPLWLWRGQADPCVLLLGSKWIR